MFPLFSVFFFVVFDGCEGLLYSRPQHKLHSAIIIVAIYRIIIIMSDRKEYSNEEEKEEEGKKHTHKYTEL